MQYREAMADLVIYHNPNCSTSRYAVDEADNQGASYDVVKYLLKAENPTREQLEALIGQLDDPVTDLIRRDATFKSLELSEDDVQTNEQVIELLLEHPKLLQRPILVANGRAIIGRPKDRVPEFIQAAQG